jgi:hypothetical protein
MAISRDTVNKVMNRVKILSDFSLISRERTQICGDILRQSHCNSVRLTHSSGLLYIYIYIYIYVKAGLKTEITAVGIRHADHVVPSIRKVGTIFADKRRSFGWYSSQGNVYAIMCIPLC